MVKLLLLFFFSCCLCISLYLLCISIFACSYSKMDLIIIIILCLNWHNINLLALSCLFVGFVHMFVYINIVFILSVITPGCRVEHVN
jgi:hypothetical protein